MGNSTRTAYISACGIGLGHIGRVVAVADELRARGVESVFSTYGPAYDYIRACGYEAYDSPMMMWEENSDGSIAVTASVAKMALYIKTFAIHMEQEKRRLLKVKPDVILVDSRYSTLFATEFLDAPYFFLSNQVKFLMPQWRERYLMRWASNRISWANYHWLRRPEAIFFPDFPPPNTISRDNASVPERIMQKMTFVGPISRFGPENVEGAEVSARNMGFDGGPFVYAAVSGPGKTRSLMIETLKNTLREFDGKSVIVKGDPRDASSEWVGDRVHIRGWTDKRFELLKTSNIVVSRPGLTTISELVRFGKKSILIPIPTQSEQEGNARAMADHGSARMIGQGSFRKETLKEALEDIVERSDEFDRCAARLRELATRYNGAAAVADRLMESIGP
jgi:uncharacterized protein (TIGR00661 family)